MKNDTVKYHQFFHTLCFYLTLYVYYFLYSIFSEKIFQTNGIPQEHWEHNCKEIELHNRIWRLAMALKKHQATNQSS